MSSEVQRGQSQTAVQKRKFRHFLDCFCSRVLINGFLEIYSQKPTILDVRVADVILDTTMKMMILSIWKRPTQRQIWIFFCFHGKYIISAPRPQKNGVFVVDHKKTTNGGKSSLVPGILQMTSWLLTTYESVNPETS